MLTAIVKMVLPLKWQRNLVYLRDLSERMDLIEATADRAAQGLADVVLRRGEKWQPQSLEEAEFRIRSQYGEDGILRYIFQHVGIKTHTFIEFGIQSGRECNSAHLALSEGWSGLFIEGDPKHAAWAREYYERMLKAESGRVKVKCGFLTKDNINKQLGPGCCDELDLLSIDIDGNDYWIWQAISARPRVVAIEYNAVFGATEPLSVPYDPVFQRNSRGDGMYFGASLAALTKLGNERGYALVGCSANGINAFFVRRDVLCPPLCDLTAAQAFRPHFGLIRHMTQEEQFRLVEKLPLAKV